MPKATSISPGPRRRWSRWLPLGLAAILLAVPACSDSKPDEPGKPAATGNATGGIPAPPRAEPISVRELPLPPVAPSDDPGACTAAVNPHHTGCLAGRGGFQSGGYLPDGKSVTARVTFAGAPAAPDPASVYSGSQLIIVRTDGKTFAGGDAWKCLTCGVPAANAVSTNQAMDYPQPFRDGKRVLFGTNILDCGEHPLADEACTPAETHIYPIRWENTADGSGKGGSLRELRIHPDDVHLGFSSFTIGNGRFGQFAYLGRLEFDPAPTTGTPLAPRYDVVKVTRLFDPADTQPMSVDASDPATLVYDRDALSVGELRGFSADGKEVTYIGYPEESSNIDVFAADLTTGKVRRLTANPEYVDPIDLSPDGNWTVAMDTRGSDRQMFLAAMRDVPPITDMVTTSATSSTRNNGMRRFFQPILIDRYGDRGDYQGQRINAAGDGSPGSVNDPNWNGMADPRWSPDGTAIVYWQALATSPACGGENPLPCETSTAQGGRTYRMMIAELTSRGPAPAPKVAPISDDVPWGVKYVPGSAIPSRPHVPAGTYTVTGARGGSAKVEVTESADKVAVETVAVAYTDFTNDGVSTLNGTEKVTVTVPALTTSKVDWFSDLTQTVRAKDGTTTTNTKKSSPDGFHLTIDVLTNIFEATGTLTTTIDGKAYRQPANRT
ncbi:hypothetical protein Ga0074812_109166 [Parafrankia irregularis]|uniref:WD40-like Beta Propeller Repeat n=1 Tax=Parafrankia irregularis TaxID=795642 RepID=A0A0S4QPK7_9ACTN|nr:MULTISPECIES: hypothetical protein [Parafrankia]MBE3200612.1 hypothetical protein [Parafrankia sp. CH37]CUU56946.1 hypothetical protein Ga0074812_109166 [Parafrankia irregularis]